MLYENIKGDGSRVASCGKRKVVVTGEKCGRDKVGEMVWEDDSGGVTDQ